MGQYSNFIPTKTKLHPHKALLKRNLTWLLAISLLLLTSACSKSSSDSPATTTTTLTADSGAEDSGTEDTGTEDSGAEDSGTEDTGTEDSGAEDSGTEDTGTEDSGAEDSGTEDTGAEDTGAEDSGTTDSGTEDTGTEDSGTEDSGSDRFTAATNTVRDGQTGYTWMRDANIRNLLGEGSGGTDWDNAQGLVDLLNETAYAGYTDWQLPTRRALAGFIGQGLAGGDFPGPFSNTDPSRVYWTRSADMNLAVKSLVPLGGEQYSTVFVYGAAVVALQDGQQLSTPKSGIGTTTDNEDNTVAYTYTPANIFTWPMRFSNEARFVDNGDGSVTDSDTGLMWSKNGMLATEPGYNGPADGQLSHTEAALFAVYLNATEFAGEDGWRLPAFEELGDLVGRSATSLPLPGPFSNLDSDFYWVNDTGLDISTDPYQTKQLTVDLTDGRGNLMADDALAQAWFVHDPIATSARIGAPDRQRALIVDQQESFVGIAKGGQAPYQHRWDFGNGHAATTQSPTAISFTSAGDYPVKYRVTDALGNSDSTMVRYTAYADSDHDGLIDQWELEYFATLSTSDGQTDTDGDGRSDADEYLHGTDPSDPDSFPYYMANELYNRPRYQKLDQNGAELPDYSTSWAMVVDANSGLTWEVKTIDDSIHDYQHNYTLALATSDFIATLNSGAFGSFNDWRLPSIQELVNLTDFSQAAPYLNQAYFPNSGELEFWSADSHDANTAIGYDYHSAQTAYLSKIINLTVRAVRGPEYTPTLVDNQDGTVSDTATGLVWEVKTDSSDSWPSDKDHRYTYAAAKSYCDNLTLTGHQDWRLPTLAELYTLVEQSEQDPAIATEFFAQTVSAEYWTADFYQDNYWYIDFKIGNILSDLQTGSETYLHHVRAVRGGYNHPNPLGRIDTPTTDTVVMVGDSVLFSGSVLSGSKPYSYLWDFDGGAPGSQAEDPGEITFTSAGSYQVTFSVCDRYLHTHLSFCNITVVDERFADYADGTIGDQQTGHLWTQDANSIATLNYTASGAIKWSQAESYLDYLNTQSYSGRNDWRLPTESELSALITDSQKSGLGSVYLPGPFSGLDSAFYWTATERTSTANGDVYVIDMQSGQITQSGKNDNNYRVWLIAGAPDRDADGLRDDWEFFYFGDLETTDGSADSDSDDLLDSEEFRYQSDPTEPTRWLINDTQTVIDYSQAMMWTSDCNLIDTLEWVADPASVRGVTSWPQALDFATSQNLASYAGYNDWRLPTQVEMIAFMGSPPSGGLNNPDFPGPFVNIKYSYWTASESGGSAYAISTTDGAMDLVPKDSGLNYTWLVRDN